MRRRRGLQRGRDDRRRQAEAAPTRLRDRRGMGRADPVDRGRSQRRDLAVLAGRGRDRPVPRRWGQERLGGIGDRDCVAGKAAGVEGPGRYRAEAAVRSDGAGDRGGLGARRPGIAAPDTAGPGTACRATAGLDTAGLDTARPRHRRLRRRRPRHRRSPRSRSPLPRITARPRRRTTSALRGDWARTTPRRAWPPGAGSAPAPRRARRARVRDRAPGRA